MVGVARAMAEAVLPEKPAEAGCALAGGMKQMSLSAEYRPWRRWAAEYRGWAEAPGNPGPQRAEAR